MLEVSVIIPTYKPEEYILECLNSLEKQTLNKNKFEVLIILNGEKEPYYEKIEKYILENNLNTFKLFYTKKSGVSNARNIGLDKAEGEYIIFVDDDDYISLNYLENCLKKIDDETVVVTDNIAFDEINKEEIIDEKILMREFNYRTTNLTETRKIFSTIWMKMIPKKIIGDIRFDKELKNGEDSLFMLEISNKIKVVEILNKETIYYRRIRNSSAHYKKKGWKEIISITNKLLFKYINLLKKNCYSKKLIFFRILSVFKGMLYLIKINMMSREDK